MSNIRYREIHYKNYGRCLSISNGLQELYVTLDIGPRIIKYNLPGMPNMMFNDLDREFKKDGAEISGRFGTGKAWYLYGGHRFWVSPETFPDTYYPDGDPVEYEVAGDTVVFSPPVQTATGWKQTMLVRMIEDKAEAVVTHILENRGGTPKTGAIWALSVMAPGGTAGIMQAREDTGYLANRTLMIWPYSDLSDPRFILENDYIFLKQDPRAQKAFKIGANNTRGGAVYLNFGCVFRKTYRPDHRSAAYPDNGVSTELYANAKFLEVETLGALVTLDNGEKSIHEETWSVTFAGERNGDSPCGILKKYL